MRKGWFLKRLRELGVSLDRETRDRLYEVARKYDDVLRVEVGEKTVTIALKRYNGGSPNRLTVRHRVERFTVPLLEVNMGQYFVLVNLDKKEYVHPHRIGGLLKLWEWCANRQAGILPYLLRQSSERGGGDIDIEEPRYAGRWAGDRIVLVGDYDESHLFQQAQKEYREISEGLVREYNGFIEFEEGRLTYEPPRELAGISPRIQTVIT